MGLPLRKGERCSSPIFESITPTFTDAIFAIACGFWAFLLLNPGSAIRVEIQAHANTSLTQTIGAPAAVSTTYPFPFDDLTVIQVLTPLSKVDAGPPNCRYFYSIFPI